MNKYHNKKTFFAEQIFDSKKEANRYAELLMLQRAGEISNLETQKKFLIVPKTDTERAAYYVADFYYVSNGKNVIEDTKSFITKKNPVYILKRKLIKYKYPECIFIES